MPSALSTTGNPSSPAAATASSGPATVRAAAKTIPASASSARAAAYPSPATTAAGGGSAGTPRGADTPRAASRAHMRDGALDRLQHRDAAAAQPLRGRAARVHALDDQRPAGLLRGRRERVDRVELARRERPAVGRVAAEVAREQHRIDLARAQQRRRRAVERAHVLLAAAGQVDRVADRRRRRQPGAQLRGQRGAGPRHGEPRLLGERRGDPAVAAAVGEHRDPAPGERAGAEQPVGGVDQLGRRPHALDPGRGAGGVDRRAVGRQRAGVRGDRPRRRLAVRDRQQDDRLARRARPRRRTRGRRGRPPRRPRSAPSRDGRRTRRRAPGSRRRPGCRPRRSARTRARPPPPASRPPARGSRSARSARSSRSAGRRRRGRAARRRRTRPCSSARAGARPRRAPARRGRGRAPRPRRRRRSPT